MEEEGAEEGNLAERGGERAKRARRRAERRFLCVKLKTKRDPLLTTLRHILFKRGRLALELLCNLVGVDTVVEVGKENCCAIH